ncbi:hypothetical protein Rhe02_83350 [Rhizocola hellebori]|uniref:Uncharacterized protein n=1 Tax=Rhizocola hellebori TaxID=1392758 RepID=A0A8J3QIX7_9ACTN|nr:hypothetical protein [Rhizocola hellebori]GIH10268.1 hypothetical protein Rhe02_83350 [Rhizocola hellebori]
MSVWTTRADELVSFGDLVALSVLDRSDAVGRIVAAHDEGLIQCVLVRGNSVRPGELVEVEEHQLLLRVFR